MAEEASTPRWVEDVSTRRSRATCSSVIRSRGVERRQSTPWTRAFGPAATRSAAPSGDTITIPPGNSAGQPIVAGWAYQFVAQHNFARESWSAPVDVRRLKPAQDANVVAAQQIEALPARLEEGGCIPLFVFDAGYDPVKLQRALEGNPCQILVRLRAGRRFYGDPSLCEPPEHIGRPRRHGPKMKCSDLSTWPEPSAEHHCEDAGRVVAVDVDPGPAGKAAGGARPALRCRSPFVRVGQLASVRTWSC